MNKLIRLSWEKDDEGDIYSSDFCEELVNDGEMDSWEAGFMKGYDEAG